MNVVSQAVDNDQDDTFVVTCYNDMGRVAKTSNPVRAGAAPTCSSSLEWTTPAYDDLGRAISITTPDNAVVTTAYSLATSGSQIGAAVTVTDQAGKVRRSITNAMGQLTRVDEPDAGGQLGDTSSPTQPTYYTYDVLNNLTTVGQGVQTRNFAYNSLSRLVSAQNPESGTIQYSYDANGNLTSKVDARTITTAYTYDALNRVLTRTYTGETGYTTPNVSYFYDNLANAKGKLIKVENTYSKTEYQAFDILGRVTQSQQTTDGTAYDPMTYTYNLSGALIEQKYPSGRIVKTSLDDDGMLKKVDSNKTPSDIWRNYANNFRYTAAGAIESMQLGNGKFENTQFNSRLQPVQIGLGSSASTQNILKLSFDYGTTDNNGNVKSQVITVPTVGTNQGFAAVQNYTYDSLNRISQAAENITGQTPPNWKQTFIYDRYGNRRFDEANTTMPSSFANQAISNPTISTVNNRFAPGQGYSYDLSGNTTVDALGRTYTYDAENKQVEVIENSVLIGKYFYDGDGKRIKKISADETVIFVYDAIGKLVAEYANQISQTPKISYLTNDNLGSPRITTDALGQVISRRDFRPFGEEISRSNYGSDSVRQKFTGYERDGETGLDFAQNRMFNYSHGRFTSPDQVFNDQWPGVPQTWNLYSYVSNNPLNFVDPSGLWKEVPCSGGNGGTRLCYESDRDDDTYLTLAELVGVPHQFLAAFFGNQAIEIGKTFDSNGFDGWLKDTFNAEVVDEWETMDRIEVTPFFGSWSKGRNIDRIGKPLGRGLKKAGDAIKNLFSKNKELKDFFAGGSKPKASALKEWAEKQGWTARQTPGGPLHYFDETGMKRMTIKKGSPRTPGSETPHMELRDKTGQRIDPEGNPVGRRSTGNHSQIEWDL
ncbi:MAG: RHS repeat-associated core domain-containing protein [Acidobacteria bacterium]|nr:RHS repeat-associated core domain-containing protein [Acidobacteriota bacterium]